MTAHYLKATEVTVALIAPGPPHPVSMALPPSNLLYLGQAAPGPELLQQNNSHLVRREVAPLGGLLLCFKRNGPLCKKEGAHQGAAAELLPASRGDPGQL